MERGRHHSGALASRLPGEFRGALARTGISGRGGGAHRWKTGELVVDVMPVEPEILGFSNRWYPGALGKARAYELPSGTEIQLVTAPYVPATKIAAFLGRGGAALRSWPAL